MARVVVRLTVPPLHLDQESQMQWRDSAFAVSATAVRAKVQTVFPRAKLPPSHRSDARVMARLKASVIETDIQATDGKISSGRRQAEWDLYPTPNISSFDATWLASGAHGTERRVRTDSCSHGLQLY
jgi:hypothetical protein